MKKYLFIVFTTTFTTNLIAQSFTLMPNSANSNALNTTANRVGINTVNPQSELHLNRLGSVPVSALFTNNITGNTSTDGLLFGINTAGEGLLHHQNNLPVTFKIGNNESLKLNQNGFIGKGNYFELSSHLSSEFSLKSEGVASIGVFSDSDISSDYGFNLHAFRENESGTLLGMPKAGMVFFSTKLSSTNWLFSNPANGFIRFGGGSSVSLSITTANRRVGINDVINPTRTLDVNGDVRFGTNGTTITSFITSTQSIDLPIIQAGGFYSQDFIISGIVKGKNAVMISPDFDMGLMGISFVWVSQDNLVTVRFHNQSNDPIDVPNMPFHITVITYP